MGLHPCSVKKDFERELYIVEEWLSKRRFSAVGEIGTDLYWDKSFWGQQQEALAIQINWAKKYGLPIVLHCRESLDQTIEIVEAQLDKVLPEIKLDQAVLETDSPYLAPVPHRGKRNEPTYIPLIASKIAALTDRPVEEVQKITSQNAMNLFNHIL
jgi:TatD DNase family protein